MYHYDLNMALEELTESTCVTWSCAQAQARQVAGIEPAVSCEYY